MRPFTFPVFLLPTFPATLPSDFVLILPRLRDKQ